MTPNTRSVETEEIRKALDWFIELIGIDEWKVRKPPIKEHIKSVLETKKEKVPLVDPSSRVVFESDQFGWYLYLAEAYIYHPEEYDFAAGSRVVPIFKSLGNDLDILKTIGGVHERAIKIVTTEKKNPDGGLFELLVAIAYMKSGWKRVEFVPESPHTKTPDIYVKTNGAVWVIECKRMSKSSDYSIKEREKWLKMWTPLSGYLEETMRPLVLDIVFHVELQVLDDDFLKQELIPKLELALSRGTIIENDIWTVKVNEVDFRKIKKHMSTMDVKILSSQLNELVFGPFDLYRGCTLLVSGKFSHSNPSYLTKIDFAAGAIWSCDADQSIEKKARHILRHLAEATEQLPENKPGIVHIGLESHDGGIVEIERLSKIMEKVAMFDSREKDIHWVFCHVFEPTVPPDKNWEYGETVYPFSKTGAYPEPLDRRPIVLPNEADGLLGIPW